jgi:hypothetical protein
MRSQADELLTTVEAVPFDRATGTVRVACRTHFMSKRFPMDVAFQVTVVEGEERRPVGRFLARHRLLDLPL